MPTQPYTNRAGARLPGTTWVIGQNLGWNKDALKFWANREGLAGREIRRDWSGETATRAADIGTASHAMIEAHIQGYEPKLVAADLLNALANDEDREKAKRGFGGFLRWFRQTRIEVIATELFGVDEEYQTGYCIDGIGLEHAEDGTPELSTVDWKTSKGTYADHAIQVAAYTVFAEKRFTEWMGQPVRFAGAYILRVAKESGQFKHLFIPRENLELPWRVFTWLRAMHQAKPQIEALVR